MVGELSNNTPVTETYTSPDRGARRFSLIISVAPSGLNFYAISYQGFASLTPGYSLSALRASLFES